MFDFLFQQPLYEALIGRRPETYNGRDAVACALALNHDGVWLPFGGFSGYKPFARRAQPFACNSLECGDSIKPFAGTPFA